MGVTAAALGLGGYAAYRAIKKATKKDDDSSDSTAASTAASTTTSTTDSAATGSQGQAIYDGMLSEEAVAKAKKKRASTGTMADEGERTFGGGALGA